MSNGIWIVLLIIAVFITATFGESADDAYTRGYEAGLHDGWIETCDDIGRFSRPIEDILKQKRIC